MTQAQITLVKQALNEVLDYNKTPEFTKNDFVEILVGILVEWRKILLISWKPSSSEEVIIDWINFDPRVSHRKKVFMLTKKLDRIPVSFTLEEPKD